MIFHLETLKRVDHISHIRIFKKNLFNLFIQKNVSQY